MARKIVDNCPSKDYLCEATSIHKWVKDNIRYIRDIHGVELLQTPVKTIELGCGDCDDQVTLICALLESIGHKCRLVLAGNSPDKWFHIFSEVFITGAWLSVETTEPWHIGSTVYRQKARYFKKVPIL